MGLSLSLAQTLADHQRKLELSGFSIDFIIPQLSNLIRAQALVGLGKRDEASTFLDSIEQQIESAEQAGDNPISAAIAKAHFYKLRQDRKATFLWVEEHRSRTSLISKDDKYIKQTNRVMYAQIFAEVGLKDDAVAELTAYYELPGAYPFLSIELQPAFNTLNNHPGYEVLREKYSNSY